MTHYTSSGRPRRDLKPALNSRPCQECRQHALQFEEVDEPDALVLELKVAEQDLGKVIGKQGRTAKALRTVLSAASSKSRRRVLLEILE